MLPADARSGTTVGKYRLHEIVGRGGMGVVYRGEHVYIGREVAVKILHEGFGSREEAIKRFLREARAASLINHPNIVEVTDFGKAQDGTVFFVMELLMGEPLDAVLARDRRLELLRAITICNQMAAALAAAHSKGIIHRDLKPENIMLMPREGRRELVRRITDESGAHEVSERETNFDFVKILDFGVAKVRETEAAPKGKVTQAGVVFGTPEYMAPETARVGFSDARSDIYALGIMFYEMLTGTVPFTGESPVDVMIKQVNEAVPPMRKVASDVEITDEAERLILKALAKEPDRRHQTMEEFHRDLQKCYGQVRFRRTVKTPTLAAQTGPTIQLTKRKKQPGAIPSQMVSGSSSSSPLGISLDEPQRITPTRPPILLTKRKLKSAGEPVTPPAGTPASAASPTQSGEFTPPGQSSQPTQPPGDRRRATVTGELVTSTPLGQARLDGAEAKTAAPADPTAEGAQSRKRTTLPMGLTESGESAGDGEAPDDDQDPPEPSGDGVPWHHEQAEAPSAASRFGPSGDGSDEMSSRPTPVSVPVVVLAAMAASAGEDDGAARENEVTAPKRQRRKTPGVPVTLVQPDGSEKQVHDETTPVVGTPAAAAMGAATPGPARGKASLDAIVPDEVIAPGIRAGGGGEGASGRRRSPVPHLAEDDERDWGAETTSPGVGNVGR